MSDRTATAALDQGTRGITSAGLNATLVTPSYRWFRRPFPGASLVQVRRTARDDTPNDVPSPAEEAACCER